MIFQRTKDFRLIRSFLTDPKCWARMVNDSAPKREDFHLEDNPSITYVVGTESGCIARALFLLCDSGEGAQTAECHFCFAPEAWGRTIELAHEFMAWVWRETSLNRLVGPVPSYNRLARKLALSVGFVHYGEGNPVQKGSKMFQVELLEALRPV